MIELELPFPPSVNCYKTIGRTIKTKNGHSVQTRVNSNETKQFYCDVANLAYKKSLKFYFSDELMDLTVEVDLYPKSRLSDVDNPLKVLLDSLQHSKIIVNDRNIRRLVVEKKAIIAIPKVIVRIKPYV